MDKYGYSSAVDICRHGEGYLAKWTGLYCGSCNHHGRMPQTWVTRGVVSHGHVDCNTGELWNSFGAFTTSMVTAAVNTTTAIGSLAQAWNQPKWRESQERLQMLSEEVTKQMAVEWAEDGIMRIGSTIS